MAAWREQRGPRTAAKRGAHPPLLPIDDRADARVRDDVWEEAGVGRLYERERTIYGEVGGSTRQGWADKDRAA